MKRAAMVLVCLALALPEPALAQVNNDDYTPLGSRIRRDRQFPLENPNLFKPRQLSKVNRKRSRDMLGQFSRCIYHRNETQALELLAKTDFGFVNFQQIGLETDQASRIYGFHDCLSRVAESHQMGVTLYFSAGALRRWLLQEAYFNRFPDGPEWVKPGYVIDQRTYPMSPHNPGVRAAMDLADCVVAADPYTADFFFRAPSGSDEEKQAERELIPLLGPCIPRGQKLEIDPNALRAWLSEALWFAANNSSPVPDETKEAAE